MNYQKCLREGQGGVFIVQLIVQEDMDGLSLVLMIALVSA
jgi:hypothetical protein